MGMVAVLFLLIFFFLPLVHILLRSFCDFFELPEFFAGEATCSFSAFRNILTDSYYMGRLGFTIMQAFLSSFFSLLIGLPLAFFFSRYDFRGKKIFRSLLSIPFVMPTVVVAIGFLSLFGSQTSLTGLDLRNTMWILLFAHVFYNVPVVLRIVSGFLEGSSQRLDEASYLLGASPWKTFLRLNLPLAMPAIVSAAILVFIFCFTSFGVIVILTPELQYSTLEVEIYRRGARMLQLDKAAVLVLVQLVVIMGLSYVYSRIQASMGLGLKAREQFKKPKGNLKIALYLIMAFAIPLLLAPLVAIVQKLFFIEGSFSYQYFSNLTEVSRSVGFAGFNLALYNSLRFSFFTVVLATLVGFAFSYAIVRANWRFLDSLSLLPLATSAVTLGFGYLISFPVLSASFAGVLLTHVLIAFPFVVRSILPALRALPTNVTDAAKGLGSGEINILRRVELPLLKPALIAAASFAFAISLGEFAATLILSRPEFATLPVAIFDRLARPGEANFGSALALAFVLMVLSSIAMFILELFGESEF